VVRKVWGKAVVAVTGSAGKTTTKEAIAQVLAARFHVFKSQGNLNNHFGLPLQLLKLDHDHEKAVVEMGMNHAGEIAALCKIAVPEWGVVTNVNPVHIEHFADGIAGVARAKYELVAALPSGGRAFLNADDPYVSQFGRDFKGKAVTFGTHPSADVRAEEIIDLGAAGSEFTLVAGGVRERGALHLMGRHNVHNALAAAAVGLEAGLAPSDCMRALAQLAPSDKRGQVKELGGAIIINDSYNSNPAALRSMTDALMGIEAKRHIVVAGEMLELGPAAVELHRQCGEYMAGRGISYLIGVRGNAVALVEGARSRGTTAEFVETPEMAAAQLKQMLQPGDAVLFKASRGVRLERAIDELERALAGNEEGVLPSSSGHD
jgi:UDP-N-acetylmuramoyl-tripeptide--D-alanyl-D-alanine ligase